MSELKDYDGRSFDFAVGEVYGLRVWMIDDYGRLRARYLSDVAAPWRPGVNTAACHAVPPESSGGILIGPNSVQVIGRFRTGGPQPTVKCACPACTAAAMAGMTPVAPEPTEQPGQHSAPTEGCTCGFYAYTGVGAEVRDSRGLIVGVIRGTGRTLIGAKGFRCEKAEIVALLDPTVEDVHSGWSAWRRDQLRAVYPDVPLLGSKQELLQFAPIESIAPAPTTDEFWSLP